MKPCLFLKTTSVSLALVDMQSHPCLATAVWIGPNLCRQNWGPDFYARISWWYTNTYTFFHISTQGHPEPQYNLEDAYVWALCQVRHLRNGKEQNQHQPVMFNIRSTIKESSPSASEQHCPSPSVELEWLPTWRQPMAQILLFRPRSSDTSLFFFQCNSTVIGSHNCKQLFSFSRIESRSSMEKPLQPHCSMLHITGWHLPWYNWRDFSIITSEISPKATSVTNEDYREILEDVRKQSQGRLLIGFVSLAYPTLRRNLQGEGIPRV